MKGLYIYCVRPRNADAGKIENTVLVSFKDIEAVAANVDLSQFSEKRLKEKLNNDPKWMEKSVKNHHAIVTEAAKMSTVIPMKFGVLFKTKKSLEAMLKKRYRKFKNLLSRLKDKQEWGVKGYLEYRKFVDILKNKNKEMLRWEKKRSSVPEGMKWYVDRKSDELIANQIEYEVEGELRDIVDKLEKRAEEIRLNDLMPKEICEPGKDMILNAACLVRNNVLGEFKKMIQEIAADYDAAGITLTLTGPWPPYNFVEIKNNDRK